MDKISQHGIGRHCRHQPPRYVDLSSTSLVTRVCSADGSLILATTQAAAAGCLLPLGLNGLNLTVLAGYQENCANFSEPHRLTPSGWSIFIPHARWDIPRYHTWCVLNIFGCKITGLQDFFQLWHQLGDPSRPRWSRTSTATWGSWQINLTRGSINPAFCSACFASFYGPCAYTRRSDKQRSSFPKRWCALHYQSWFQHIFSSERKLPIPSLRSQLCKKRRCWAGHLAVPLPPPGSSQHLAGPGSSLAAAALWTHRCSWHLVGWWSHVAGLVGGHNGSHHTIILGSSARHKVPVAITLPKRPYPQHWASPHQPARLRRMPSWACQRNGLWHCFLPTSLALW